MTKYLVDSVLMEQDRTVVRKRCNTFYIYTGPAYLLAPATPQQLRDAISRMVQVSHVNRNIVAAELRKYDAPADQRNPWPMTLIELMYLERAKLGQSLRQYCASLGVAREYHYDKAARPEDTVNA